MRRMIGFRILMVTAAVWTLLPLAASAQTAAALRHACLPDYARHCTGDDPPVGLERACLAQYYVNLSPPCRAALDAARSASDAAADSAGQ